MSKKSKQNMTVVVDASIAKSASETEKPISKSCRDILNIIEKKRYYIAMNKCLYMEWNKHKSIFATKWLSGMIAKGLIKTIRTEDKDEEVIQVVVGSYYEGNINKNERDAIFKDIHLATIALNTDKTIISRDDKIKSLFYKISNDIDELINIVWINPVLDEEAIQYFEKKNEKELEKRALKNICS